MVLRSSRWARSVKLDDSSVSLEMDVLLLLDNNSLLACTLRYPAMSCFPLLTPLLSCKHVRKVEAVRPLALQHIFYFWVKAFEQVGGIVFWLPSDLARSVAAATRVSAKVVGLREICQYWETSGYDCAVLSPLQSTCSPPLK